MASGIWINENTFYNFKEPRKTMGEEIATRKRSWDFTSMMGYLPNPDETLKKLGKDIKVYSEIKLESHVATCILDRMAGVKSLQYGINRGKAKSRQAREIEAIFNNLPIQDIIKDILDANYFGYQPIEINWAGGSRLTYPEKIIAKPADWFIFSDENELRFKSKDSPFAGEQLPPKKFLCPTYNASYINPYGTSLLSSIFWYAAFKKDAVKFWVVCTEKYGMPYVIGKIQRGATDEDINKLLAMLENMVQDAVSVIYDDNSVEIKSDPFRASSANIYRGLIDVCNEEISKAILGQTLTTQVNDKVTLATGKVHKDVLQSIVDMDTNLVKHTFNQLIKWINEINFVTANDIPTFDMWYPEDVDKELAERDKTLTETGVKFTKSYYIKNYGLEEDDFEIETVTKDNFPEEKQPPAQFEEKTEIEDYIDNSELQMANLKFLFNLPPEKAIEYLRKKKPELSDTWYDIWGKANNKTFTIAGVTRMDILMDIREELTKAMEEGKTLRQFKKDLKSRLQVKGWINDKGTPWRLKTIYETNTQASYQAGRYLAMTDNAEQRPYWM